MRTSSGLDAFRGAKLLQMRSRWHPPQGDLTAAGGRLHTAARVEGYVRAGRAARTVNLASRKLVYTSDKIDRDLSRETREGPEGKATLMRKLNVKTLVLGTVLASAALAQMGGGMGNPPSSADMVANRVARLTKLLSLTTAQQTQATTIFTAAENTLSSLRTSMQTARTSLNTAIKNSDTAGISSAATQIGGITTQEVQTQATAEAAFYAILTAEQKTKYDQSGPAGGGGWGGRGMGMGMGRPRQ
jgi:Spy/CpxP family protein refolding chaperone